MAGAVNAVGFFLYLLMTQEKAVATTFAVMVVLAPLLGYFFLGETFSGRQLIGFAIIFMGMMVALPISR
jgi:drug/metabolite transporter (DMT)-like permease